MDEVIELEIDHVIKDTPDPSLDLKGLIVYVLLIF
jgi:hypothetical protein